MPSGKTDRFFILIISLLVLVGIFVFTSASLGILAKNQAIFSSMVANQLLLGLAGGIAAFFAASRIPYHFWRKYALLILIFSFFATALVFLPGIGFSHGGSTRWIVIFGQSFQPSELLKLGLVISLSAWFSGAKNKSLDPRIRTLVFIGLIAIAAAIMLKQPDTGTFLIMAAASFAVYFAAGAPWKHLLYIILLAVIGLSLLVMTKPYLKDRLDTFIDPTKDPRGSSYQIRQSLIAIGSGGIFGRGLGQSVQKFSYLPEPVGDSVFAVIGEELGFAGAAMTVFLFLLFALRGLKIASRASDPFGSYLAVGIVTLVVTQSFLNISSLIGIFPLTGVPLAFISHGGTALLFALAEAGIVVNISASATRV